MLVDFDDFSQTNHRFDLLTQLKEANPAFKATVFAVPTLGGSVFWESIPTWLELAMHGWTHSSPYECLYWTERQMDAAIARRPIGFVRGFKAPGWQISDGCYQALHRAGWWVADQPYNDDRRPPGLKAHRNGDGDHWHGHIQNVCGNGLEERFDELLALVKKATEFQFVSEVVK